MAKARVVVGVALLFSNLVVTASMQTRGRGIIAGEVRGNGGETVAGATVKLMLKSSEPLEASSDKEGRWRILGIGKGEWTMLVTAPGYAPRVVKMIVERESTNGDPVITVMRKMTLAQRTN